MSIKTWLSTWRRMPRALVLSVFRHVILQSIIVFVLLLPVLLIYSHTQPFNGLWSGTTRVGLYQKKHSPTHTHLIVGHPLSTFSIHYYPQHPLCLVYVLDSPFRQPVSRSYLVFLLGLLTHSPHKICMKTANVV